MTVWKRYGTGDAVISLKGVGLVKTGVYDLETGKLHCGLDIARGKGHEADKYVAIELQTGIMTPTSASMAHNEFDPVPGKEVKGMWRWWNDEHRKICYHDIHPDVARLIFALASHQVEGDQILKGLRLLGYKTGTAKLVSNYLGGWTLINTKDSSQPDVANLVQIVLQQTQE